MRSRFVLPAAVVLVALGVPALAAGQPLPVNPPQPNPVQKAAAEIPEQQRLERLQKTLLELRNGGYSDRHPDVVRARLEIAALTAPPAAAQQPAPEPPSKKLPASEPVPRRGFNVVLLLGDMQDAGGQDTVPVAARKALSDMKDFLPYKGYRLLDTQWVLASYSGPAITRLRGADDQEYELELRGMQTFQPGPTGLNTSGISVRFLLREPGDSAAAAGSDSGRTALHPKELSKADATGLEISRELFQLQLERDELSLALENGRSKVEVGLKDPAELKQLQLRLSAINKRIADLKQSLAATASKTTGRAVIDTSFRMDDGETVVVGTSKVKGGGKALIALLTATVERSKSSTK